MKHYKKMTLVTLLLSLGWSQLALADCAISEAAMQLDSLEVGFCEADAVFVGKSEGAIETIRAHTAEGSTITKHYRTQRTTMRVLEQHKGTLADKVTMIADLYAKDGAFAFEAGKTYLIFAKQLSGENEFAGATAKCSVQPTLLIAAAANALKRLEQHRRGRKKIDCDNIRQKAKS